VISESLSLELLQAIKNDIAELPLTPTDHALERDMVIYVLEKYYDHIQDCRTKLDNFIGARLHERDIPIPKLQDETSLKLKDIQLINLILRL
jgi:hypothetical protein